MFFRAVAGKTEKGRDLYLGTNNLLSTSAETGYGKQDVLEKIMRVIAIKNQPSPDAEDGENSESDADNEPSQANNPIEE